MSAWNNAFQLPKPRRIAPEEAFDQMIENYARTQRGPAHGAYAATESGEALRGQVSAIPVDHAKRMFVNYVSMWESFYRNVQESLHDHMQYCTSAPPFLVNAHTGMIKDAFEIGHVLHCDRRSGKTTALFDAAEEVSQQTQSRVALVGPYKEQIVAEASRRRLRSATPNQFARLEFIGENELDKLRGCSHDVMVDEWFHLSERTRELLAGNYRILAAVGTYPHCTSIKVKRTRLEG